MMLKLKKLKNNRFLLLLVAVFIICTVISGWALRQNNLNMIRLRQTVYTADEQNGDIESALNDLRVYVYSHMNTDLRSSGSSEPPIQLVYRFNRALEAEQARVAAMGSANKVYIDAQAQCEISSLPLTARAQCIQDYVSEHGQGIPQLNLPPKELYTFDFASPTWSPDLAGVMIVISTILILVIIGEIIVKTIRVRVLKHPF